MYINIKYFGLIAEVTTLDKESLEFSGVFISNLLEELYNKYPELRHKNFQVAQNQELVPVDAKITGKDIALLPPFAGG